MGYYMRYMVTDGDLRIEELQQALAAVDPAYRLEIHAEPRNNSGDLYYGDQLYAEVEVNRPGDELFEDEIDELLEVVEEAGDAEAPEQVARVLREATAIVGVRVLWQGRDPGPTLARLDPLWEWLHEHREGMLQADGEGYYDVDGLVLESE